MREVREWEGARFIGEAPMPRGVGFSREGEDFGVACGIGPCPMREGLGGAGRFWVGEVQGKVRLRGLRDWEGVRFIGEAPMPRGGGFSGEGRILGRLVASGLAR